MKRPIYLDHQATTPLDPRVLEAMLPYFRERFGNASSKTHLFGWEADAAVRRAREQVAAIVNADPLEVVFTSGSTEAINLGLKGAAEAHRDRGDHVITCATEHPAVLDTCAWLAGRGFRVTVLGVDRHGAIDLAELERALADRAILVALMAANNEIGTLHPVDAIGRLCRKHGALFFCDATQAVGKIPVDVRATPFDLLCFSGHKLYGPKGAGALWVRGHDPQVRIAPQMHGGGQEGGLRAGTSNVPGIVGLGAACEIAAAALPEEGARLTALRDRLRTAITGRLDDVLVNGHPTERLPGNLNLAFRWVEGEALMTEMRDVAVSSGSACSSANLQASHVLTAIGLDPALAHASIRFGLGRTTTAAEIDAVADLVVAGVMRLRELSPLYELAKRKR